MNLPKKKKPRTKDEYLRSRGNEARNGTGFSSSQDEKDLVQRSENFRKWEERPKKGMRGYASELVRKVTDRVPFVANMTARQSPEVAGRVRNPLFRENAGVNVKGNDPAPRPVLTAEKRTGAKYESHYESDSGHGNRYGSDPMDLSVRSANREKAITKAKPIYSNIEKRFSILSKKALRRTDDMGGGAIYAAVSLLLASIVTVLIMVSAGVFIPGTAIGTVISYFIDGPGSEDTGISPKQAVQILIQERDESIRGIEFSVKHDRLEYDVREPEWLEIFAVYSVLTSASGEETVNLMSFDDNGMNILRKVFAVLYRVEYRTEMDQFSQSSDTVQTVLLIYSVSVSVEETAGILGMDDKESNMINEILNGLRKVEGSNG